MLATRGVRRSARRGTAGLAAAAVALLSGCGIVSVGAPKATSVPSASAVAGTAQSTPSPGTSGATGATTAAPATGAQARLLAALPERPATAKDWNLAQNPTTVGLITPEQFIETFYTPSAWTDERSLQKERGLQSVARRLWFDPVTGIYVDTYILHFATAAGADSYYLARVKTDAKLYDTQGSYSVPGFTQSKVLVKAELDSFGNSKSLAFALAGDNVCQLSLLNPAAPDHAAVTALLTGEHKALGQ